MQNIKIEDFHPLLQTDYKDYESLAVSLGTNVRALKGVVSRYRDELPEAMMVKRKDSNKAFFHSRMFNCWLLGFDSVKGIGFYERELRELDGE